MPQLRPGPARRALAALVAARALPLLAALGTLRRRPPARPRARRPRSAPSDTVIDGPAPTSSASTGCRSPATAPAGWSTSRTSAASPHVFVSRLAGGALPDARAGRRRARRASSQPVIAAGQRRRCCWWRSSTAGTLYVVAGAGSSGRPLARRRALFAGAANPAISISQLRQGLPGVHRARGRRRRRAGRVLLPRAVGARADAAERDPGRRRRRRRRRGPQVATAGDGVGIVAWGEDGHIFTRRVSGTSPSVVYEQADRPTLDGWRRSSAERPRDRRRRRLLLRRGRLRGDAHERGRDAVAGAGQPAARLAVRRRHRRPTAPPPAVPRAPTSPGVGGHRVRRRLRHLRARLQSNELYATTLGRQREPRQGTLRVDSLPNSGAADAVPATAGLISTLIAWQQTPGIAGPPEIRVRYASDGSDLGPEQVVSAPTLGPTDADAGSVRRRRRRRRRRRSPGCRAAGAAARRSSPRSSSSRPAASCPSSSFQLRRPPPTGAVLVGGLRAVGPAHMYTVKHRRRRPSARPPRTAIVPPAPLANGRHIYQVTPPTGRAWRTDAPAATVFVDTVAPPWHGAKLTGIARSVHTREQLRRQLHRPATARCAHVGCLRRRHGVGRTGATAPAGTHPAHHGKPPLHAHPHRTRSR